MRRNELRDWFVFALATLALLWGAVMRDYLVFFLATLALLAWLAIVPSPKGECIYIGSVFLVGCR